MTIVPLGLLGLTPTYLTLFPGKVGPELSGLDVEPGVRVVRFLLPEREPESIAQTRWQALDQIEQGLVFGSLKYFKLLLDPHLTLLSFLAPKLHSSQSFILNRKNSNAVACLMPV